MRLAVTAYITRLPQVHQTARGMLATAEGSQCAPSNELECDYYSTCLVYATSCTSSTQYAQNTTAILDARGNKYHV